MEASLRFWSVPVLLLVFLNSALTLDRTVYFTEGGELVLLPAEIPADITNIEWQFNSAKGGVHQVVQWVKDKFPLTYYALFKGRANLNLTTGELRLSRMKSDDVGKFTVEINNEQQRVKFDAKLMKELRKTPEIHVKPLSCSSDRANCTLSCSAETDGAEPVTYYWSRDDKTWEELQKDLTIVNKKDSPSANTKSYRCRVKNHVSQQDSQVLKDPFSRPTPEPSDPWPVVVGVLVPLAVLAVAAFLLYCFREREPVKSCLSVLPCFKGNPPAQPTNGEPATDAEMKGLKQGET